MVSFRDPSAESTSRAFEHFEPHNRVKYGNFLNFPWVGALDNLK